MAFRTSNDTTTSRPADPQAESCPQPGAPALGAGLKRRHVTMLAISGAIGAGLFLGAGAGIHTAGPGILISYTLAGLLMVLVMRMLAEMAVAQPNSGSFSVYAEKAFGRWAGFTVGWLYWWLLAVVVAAEATGAAAIAHSWLPTIPQWAFVLAFMAALTVVNLFSVGHFGEFEFWFGAIKVTAVVAFLVLGSLAVFGLLPGTQAVGMTNLTDHGGFLPHGVNGVLTGLLAVVFSFGGMELVTIAAAESPDPSQAVAKTTRTVIVRLLIFYIGSVALMVLLLPWSSASAATSPFVSVLQQIGIPASAALMNVIVLTSLLSALNSNLYGASRMAFSLAQRREAPQVLLHVSSSGVPRRAVLASVSFGFIAVILNFLAPDRVLPFLLNTIGAVILVVWIAIALSQLRLRQMARRTPDQILTVRMWGHPWLSWTALAGMVGVLALMCTDTDARTQLLSTGVLTALILLAAAIRAAWAKNQAQP
ncbi:MULTISPECIES: amino acid permease [unclassified Streptomyces]|uniref:amino acid permease n=1 Tax=unclassified Streptomyces TaxID=2593676 RepID=UPI00225882C6|nr:MULTISPECIES: amino acid permease [unclassified Streptomyces]WSP53763.1 amino acid permease [Streptomyces sp. NBC_01241]WSU25569.1 amino acid permease [Streptomyces sp. NBC_01108]MCX4785166.1 amino acid permease [Streptomyces sp. NBC_01221]MCX4798893.1 amino acid permease [Streptomyces sp. NBC_01242]WSJ40094.1 amino acid permease [Streptomyces sp. NBC_01321]